jgi:hypothetical protein
MAGEFRGRGAAIGVGEAATGAMTERIEGQPGPEGGDNCNGSSVVGLYK